MTDILAVWGAWRAYHPSAGAAPPKADAKLIATALGVLPAERLVRVVQWAHDAPHRAASFLRGPTYETARTTGKPGLTGDYLAVKNLTVQSTLLQRDGWAEEWEAAGRPVFTDATPTTGKQEAADPVERGWTYVLRLATVYGETPPAEHANPDAGQHPTWATACELVRVLGLYPALVRNRTTPQYLKAERALFGDAWGERVALRVAK